VSKKLPENHVKTALVMGYLGSVYMELGDYEKARDLLNKSLLIHETNFGADHIDTARLHLSLGQLDMLEDNLELAERRLTKSFNIYKLYNNPERYTPLESLAELCLKKSLQIKKIGKFQQSQELQEQALHYFKQALEVVENHFNKDSPHFKRIHTSIKKLKLMSNKEDYRRNGRTVFAQN
jgi:tetratricopeptide (TPR) repeat protein